MSASDAIDGSAVACVAVDQTTGNTPGTRIEQWYPLTAGSSYYEAGYSEVWSQVESMASFPNTCRCTDQIDNGAGLSWSLTIAAGASTTVSNLTTFSPLGRVPLTVTKTADQASAIAGATDGYTITITNPNTSGVALDSVTDTLPAGFSYQAGSSSGLTTTDPAIVGQGLTWSGPLTIGAGASATLHFSVNVATTPGSYFNSASATASGYTVLGSGSTAQITVTAPPSADLSISKTDAPDPVLVGGSLTYTLAVHNAGPDTAAAAQVSDTLPAAATFVSASTTVGACSGTTTVSCALGPLTSGSDATITIVVTPTAAGPLSNTATVSSTTGDPQPTNNSSTATTTVQVPTTNRPPDCSSVVATPNVLWPPNHKLQTVTLLGGSDPDGDAVTITITGVTQNEPAGPTPDAVLGPAPNQVLLRSERLGTGDGRIYVIAYTLSDGHGGTCSGTVTVVVPHDQGQRGTVSARATAISASTRLYNALGRS